MADPVSYEVLGVPCGLMFRISGDWEVFDGYKRYTPVERAPVICVVRGFRADVGFAAGFAAAFGAAFMIFDFCMLLLLIPPHKGR